MVKSIFCNKHAENKQENETNVNKQPLVYSSRCPSLTDVPLKDIQKLTSSKETPNSDSGETCQSLITTKTLLNATAAPLLGQIRKSVTAQAPVCVLSLPTVNCNPPKRGGHVLCSTTVGCIPNLPGLMKSAPTDEEEGNLIVETDERCGSYDDVMLPFDETDSDAITTADFACVSNFDSRFEGEGTDFSYSLEGPLALQRKRTESMKIRSTTGDSSMTCKSANMCDSNVSQKKGKPQSENCFAVPNVVDWSKLNHWRVGHLKLDGSHKHNQKQRVSPVRTKHFVPERTFTPNPSTMRPEANTTRHREPLKSLITIYRDHINPAAQSPHPSACGSLHPSKDLLTSLPTNTLFSRAKRDSKASAAKVLKKITSPLCACGRRARRQVVSNGGPNHGRGFYCCPVRRCAGGGGVERGCGFFKWESALLKSSSVTRPAAGSSVSMCQVNSTLPHRPPPRKSY